MRKPLIALMLKMKIKMLLKCDLDMGGRESVDLILINEN
jgi:hypothetical protein